MSSEAHVGAPPFYGTYESFVPVGLGVPIVVGLLLVALGPAVIDRLRWRWVPTVAGLLSAGWALAVQQADDRALTAPLTTEYDYLAAVPSVSSPLDFLRTYVERLPEYPTHVRGHPPGAVLLGWGLEHAGLGGPNPLLVTILAGWAVAVAAVLIALRAVAGESAARRACLPIVVAPSVVWVATSVDALIAGVAGAAVAMVIVALARPSGRRTDALAGCGGAVFGLALLLSYGMAVLVAVPAAVGLHRRRFRPLVVAAMGATAVLLLAAPAGFWWFDGLLATRAEYDKGLASVRPYGYFLVGNLAVFAVACGPALALGLASARAGRSSTARAASVLAAGGLAAVILADVSGMSKAEVERIWLPFLPWVLAVVATTDERAIPVRMLMAGQIGCGLLVQIVVRSSW